MSVFIKTKNYTFFTGLVFYTALLAISTITALSAAQDAPKSASDSGITANRGVKVTIAVFSGRENPTFFITDAKTLEAIGKMVGRAKTNSVITDGAVMPSRLGYRGVIVENTGNVPNLPSKIELNGIDMKTKDAGTRYLMDDGSLEDLLIEEAIAREVIDAAIADHIDAVRSQ